MTPTPLGDTRLSPRIIIRKREEDASTFRRFISPSLFVFGVVVYGHVRSLDAACLIIFHWKRSRLSGITVVIYDIFQTYKIYCPYTHTHTVKTIKFVGHYRWTARSFFAPIPRYLSCSVRKLKSLCNEAETDLRVDII